MAAAPVLAGDYDGNGIVDASDYIVWRSTLGTTVPAHSGADGDGDGMIGAGDYQIWSGNFGATSPGSGAGAFSLKAVPEPSTLALALFGFVAAILMTRRNASIGS